MVYDDKSRAPSVVPNSVVQVLRLHERLIRRRSGHFFATKPSPIAIADRQSAISDWPNR